MGEEPSRPAEELPDRTSRGRWRLILRFALGVAELTSERVGAVLSACAAAQTPPLVGARPRSRTISIRRRAGRLDRAGKLVGRFPGMPRVLGRCRAWRDRGRMQLARWAELGRRKQAENRALASDALTVLRENLLARVSESPDVKSVIREQSEGIAVTAMGELRESSARPDNLVEQAVGRLFGRGRITRTQ